MKSAYELALERMERDGMERPQDGVLSDEAKAEIAEIRRRAEAKLAELEILHKDRLAKIDSVAARDQEEDDYTAERRRIEDDRDRKIDQVRRAGRG